MSDASSPVEAQVRGATTQTPQYFETEAFIACISCRASPQREDDGANEDAAAFIDLGGPHAIAVVADGVGGRGNGAAASACVLDQVVAFARPLVDPSSRASDASSVMLIGSVIGALEAANEELLSGTGTPAATAVVATLWADEVRIFHAGDAEALLVGQRGRIKLQTIKHGPAGYAEAAGVVDEAGALEHPDRHLISNMVGMQGMKIEIDTAITMATRDTLVLGSDGLFDKLPRPEIAEIVRRGPLEEAAAQLEAAVDAAAERDGHGDDCTFILLRARS